HLVWARQAQPEGPCPAVQRRLGLIETWTNLMNAGWRPNFPAVKEDPLGVLSRRLWNLVPQLVPPLTARLAPWLEAVVPLQPCLCDLWHDHVLFEGDRVTGLIDYGAVKTDNVAVDLARLRGSLLGPNPPWQRNGLEAYEAVRPLSAQERRLVAVLEESGAVLGAVNWLKWLSHDGRRFDDRTAVARRLAALLARLEGSAG